jgi:hypothetical protein
MKFRVTETTNSTFQDAEGSLPFNIDGLGPDGEIVRVKIWNTSAGVAVVVPPYNVLAPDIGGTADVGQVLSMVNDTWNGADLFNYWWYSDGVQVATTATYTVVTGDRGKTITGAKQAQGVGGSVASAIIPTRSGVLIPASGGDGVLVAEEYAFSEAVADADTRKTYVEIYDAPTSGYEWIVYRGPLSTGDLATVAVAAFDGTNYVWTSTGQATVGTGPAGRTVVYVRIGLREIAVPANKYFVTPVGENFLASSIPGVPAVSYAQGAGQGEIYVTINTAADGAGRTITGYEYQLNGGTWTTLPGGAAVGQRTINTGTPTTSYSIAVRGVNVNGAGIASAPEFATSGAVSVVPSAFGSGDWSLTDKPSATGNTVTVGFTTLPSTGGASITDVQYQVNAGAFVSMGTTPTSVDVTVPATTLVNIQIRAVNAVGNGATATKSITPTTIAAATNTAYFGADTFANAGSWRPETTLGDEVTLTSFVSNGTCTRTWNVVGGALVCTNGTPAVDNGKTVTVGTAAGNIVVTISTVANAWSVATAAELSTALAASNASPATIFLRPRLYDLGRGPGSATPAGQGVLQRRTYTGTNRRTLDKHTGQVKKPWSLNTTSLCYDTAYLTIKNFNSRVTVNMEPFLISGKSTGAGTNNITIQFCDFAGPEVPDADLQDPTLWTTGYAGALHQGIDLYTSQGFEWNTVVEDCTFRNVQQAGNFTVLGAFSFQRNTGYNVYYDYLRIRGFADNGEAKVIADNTAERFFAINNEQSFIDPVTGLPENLEPHNDFMQLIGGQLDNALIMRNRCVRAEPVRGDVLQGFFTNYLTNRCVFFSNIISNRDSSWGLCLEMASYCSIANNTIIPSNLGSCQVRLGVLNKGIGEQIVQNTVVRVPAAAASAYTTSSNSTDALFITPLNNFDSPGFNVADNFNWPSEPSSLAQLMTYATPKSGGAVDVAGVGALDTAGAWRTQEWPPLAGAKPTLANSAADLIVTPATSKLAYTTPASWDIAYRNANGTSWTYVTGRTGANHTLVAPNKVNIQVMCRWIGTNGLKGPWSEAQTVIV